MSITLFPAIRSRVGDWITYVTTMSFKDINSLISSPDEIHERQKLSDWIQREAIETHAEEIAEYIRDNPQRFLGSLIVGVYDGAPDWAPLTVNFTIDQWDLNESQKEKVEGKLGLLKLSGSEKLFAIDGQHRVAGIKKYIENTPEGTTHTDEVSAIFVSHDNTSDEGRKRTRRLFTTVNKKARKISKTAKIALDEDNGFAIITRRIIDEHWLFEDERAHISYSSTGSIGNSEVNTITSVVGLYEIIRDLYSQSGRRKFEQSRPSNEELEEHLNFVKKLLR